MYHRLLNARRLMAPTLVGFAGCNWYCSSTAKQSGWFSSASRCVSAEQAKLRLNRERVSFDPLDMKASSWATDVIPRVLNPVFGGEKPVVALVACGSFSPVTNGHLRAFEVARNQLVVEDQSHDVVLGLLSPVHDAYGKASLVPQHHRINMTRMAAAHTEWIAVSDWECRQDDWTLTANVLYAYGEALKALPTDYDIHCMLLCGADLLESVLVPGLWSDDHLDIIFRDHGVVVLERDGLDLDKLIHDNPKLKQYSDHIVIIRVTTLNPISSSLVRQLLASEKSPAQLLPCDVLNYIYQHSLFDCTTDKYGAKHKPGYMFDP